VTCFVLNTRMHTKQAWKHVHCIVKFLSKKYRQCERINGQYFSRQFSNMEGGLNILIHVKNIEFQIQLSRIFSVCFLTCSIPTLRQYLDARHRHFTDSIFSPVHPAKSSYPTLHWIHAVTVTNHCLMKSTAEHVVTSWNWIGCGIAICLCICCYPDNSEYENYRILGCDAL